MWNPTNWILSIAAACLCALQQQPWHDPWHDRTKGAAKELQGTWVVVKPEDGKRDGEKLKLVFAGRRVTWKVDGEEDSWETLYWLDPASDPKGVSFMTADLPMEGSYVLEGDTLKIRVGVRKNPKELMTLKRGLGSEIPSRIDARAVPELVSKLKNESAGVRYAAVIALGRLGPRATGAISALIEATQDSDDDFGLEAALALGRIGPEALPVLMKLLKEGNAGGRKWSTFAIAQLGARANEAVPSLVDSLRDRDTAVRRNAAFALEQIGMGAKTAVQALVAALRDKDFWVRYDAAEALKKIDPEAAAKARVN